MSTELGAEHPLGRSVCELKIFVEHPPSWGKGDVINELFNVVNEITEDTRIIILGATITVIGGLILAWFM